MNRLIVPALLLLAAVPAITGCNGNFEMTSDQVALASYGTSYAASYAGTRLSVEQGGLDPEKLEQVADVIDSEILPLTTELEDSNDLYVIFYPVVEHRLAPEIDNATVRAAALGLTSQGLRVGQSYLEGHPDVAAQKGMYSRVANSVLKGVRDGIRDSLTPPETDAAMPRKQPTVQGG